ncbi:MAG: flavin reductase family protein [Bacteroidota bacterium]
MNKILSIDPSSLSTQKLHGYLLSGIAPRPIAFASTVDKNGKVNLSPFSYFNVFSANPPVLIFAPARRGRDGTHKHTYENIKEVPEVVINMVNYPMVEKMSLASTEYDKGINEFVKAGFKESPSEVVKPPRVLESPVSFECTVDQVIELGEEGGAGNLIISKIVRIHIDSDYMKDDQSLDTEKLDYVGRLGENWYVRAHGKSLFEIEKPVKTKGIGVDQLSPSIRNSNILSANNLGRLGNLERQPTMEEIEEARHIQKIKELFLEFEGQRDLIKDGLHRIGKKYIEKGNASQGHAVLRIVDEI